MSKDIITEEKAEELYREMLDDNYPVKIGDLNYNASNVLAESKEDAIGMVLDGVVDGVEVEMTLHPEALEEGEF